jgi:acyl-CoA synthetase (AMP-forming)/AMP-acid ligase II
LSSNFYAHIARTLPAQPGPVLLTWPATATTAAASYTGAQIEQQVAALRQQLAESGVQPGQRVLLLLPVSQELITALLGILAHGSIVVLPPAGATSNQLLRLVRRGNIRAAVLARKPGWLLAGLAKVLRLRLLHPVARPVPAPVLPPQSVPPTQPALVTHTSGSTGQPKQIVRTHRVLSAQHAVLKELFPPWPGQRDFPLFPNVLLHNLAAGAASILPAVPWADLPGLNPATIVRQLVDEEVHTLTGNVFYFQRLLPELRKEPGGFPRVRALGVGGSPVPEWLVQELKPVFPNAQVYVIYGSSEAEPIAVRAIDSLPLNPALGYAVGRIVPSLELRLEPLGELQLPNNETPTVGEIMVRGPHVASTAPGGWLRTGDFGYLAADGQLFLTGRQGNEALRHGAQHYQLEHLLQHLPGVERVAARPEPAGFALYIQGQASEEAVRTALAPHFPAAICTAIHCRPQLPVDLRHHSKIRYAEVH